MQDIRKLEIKPARRRLGTPGAPATAVMGEVANYINFLQIAFHRMGAYSSR